MTVTTVLTGVMLEVAAVTLEEVEEAPLRAPLTALMTEVATEVTVEVAAPDVLVGGTIGMTS